MSKAVSSSIHHRMEQFTKAFGSSSDLAVSSFHTGAGQIGILIFLQGMSDQDKIDQLILPWLQKEGQTRRITPEYVRG